MTQDELSKHLRITRQAVGNYEQGTRFPQDETILLAIADLFEVSLDYLLGRTDIEHITIDLICEDLNDYNTEKTRALKKLFLSIQELPSETILKICDVIQSFKSFELDK